MIDGFRCTMGKSGWLSLSVRLWGRSDVVEDKRPKRVKYARCGCTAPHVCTRDGGPLAGVKNVHRRYVMLHPSKCTTVEHYCEWELSPHYCCIEPSCAIDLAQSLVVLGYERCG